MFNSSHSQSFSSRRQIPCVVSFNVCISNFSPKPSPSNRIFPSIITILLNFLQIQSSGKNPSPFELHPVTSMASVGCSLAYYLTATSMFMFPDFAPQFGVLMSVFGSLAVATLISLILQLPWWSVLFIGMFVRGILQLVYRFYGVYNRIHPQSREIPTLTII